MARTKDFDEKEVLSKAIDLFWRKGYHATSMQDLVDTLGISRSSLYDTYGDKHELYLKALEAYQQSAGDQLCSIISNSASAKKAIQQLLEYIIYNMTQDTDQKGCFMVNAEVEIARNDQKVSEIVCKHDQVLEGAFARAIKEGQESGEITSRQDALALARFIMNTVKGLRVSAKSGTDERVFNDIMQTTLTVLD